jgi:hypothetical protein
MKIIVKLENETPIFFFPEEKERDGSIVCYSPREGHSSASRAYMRGLKSPATKGDIVKCWHELSRYAQHAAYCENLQGLP